MPQVPLLVGQPPPRGNPFHCSTASTIGVDSTLVMGLYHNRPA